MKQKPLLKSLLTIFALTAYLTLAPTFCLAQPVSRETAQQAAKTFLDNNGAPSSELADVSTAAGFSNVYVFTTGHSFVLMAADSRVQPVLGYSLNGPFDTEKMPENVREWLQGYDEEIQWAIDNSWRASSTTTRQWQDLEHGVKGPRATTVVTPLIQTKWNQSEYYNQLCPLATGGPNGHAFTGCVATAMAQIMKFWEYPTHGIGSHAYTWGDQTLSADFGSTTYDWSNMLAQYYYYYDDNGNIHWLSTPTEQQISAVATLMYHCGVSVDMDYGGGGSGAVTAYVADALKTYFNYSPDIEYKTKAEHESEWMAIVKAELDAGRPLQYSGRSSSSGHSFICDGYNSANYFHFNWGWSGAYDGYFSLDNLNTGANNQSGQGNGVYTSDQSAIFGIQPVQCSAAEPTDLTYTLAGLQDLTLSWTEASGAVSYNIYCNSNYVGNTSTASYSETAPFGTNIYYVRSVDANGNLSLSSNTVTVTVGYQSPVVDDLAAAVEGHNVNLSWTAPAWCYPETESAILNYGEGNLYSSWTAKYYGHRHLAANMAQYAGKAVYKIGTYIQYPGTYTVYVYTNNNMNGQPSVSALAATKASVFNASGWQDIILDSPVILSGSTDLWVVLKQENTGQDYPTPSFNLSDYNANACYAGSYSPTSLSSINLEGYRISWFINIYLTDGVYTYNLYRDGTAIANQISDIQYTDSNRPDGEYAYYVKTNYYGGETEASNTVTVTVPGLPTQTVALNEGWTWWSPTVETSLAELETALGGNGLIINSQDGGFARYEVVNGQGTWSGTLQGFVPGQMYKIAVQTAGTITLTGTPVAPSPINILQGYNWFGYTGVAGLTIAETLGVFEPAENDQIIGQEGTATYSGGAWSGLPTGLVPGHGYVYVSTATEQKTVIFK